MQQEKGCFLRESLFLVWMASYTEAGWQRDERLVNLYHKGNRLVARVFSTAYRAPVLVTHAGHACSSAHSQLIEPS